MNSILLVTQSVLKMLTDEDAYRFTVPGASPFFTEEPLRDAHSICRVLRSFGYDEPNKRNVESAVEFFSDDDCLIPYIHAKVYGGSQIRLGWTCSDSTVKILSRRRPNRA